MKSLKRVDWLFVCACLAVGMVMGELLWDTCGGTQCLAMFGHTVTTGR